MPVDSDRSAEIRSGRLIINADDWGRDCGNTDRILDCIVHKTVSSASAMVFMSDSERAAEIARERGIDVGLHLNLTAPFTGGNAPAELRARQQELAPQLLRRWYSPVVYYPALSRAFAHVVSAQIEEFQRLYMAPPKRLDGHHHMHLATNILLGGLLPPGTIVRRNFTFRRGEKGFGNRLYRSFVDRMLARRHRLSDYFYSLKPLAPPSRLERIFSLAQRSVVEVEAHPVNPEEYKFLMNGEIGILAGDVPVAPRFEV